MPDEADLDEADLGTPASLAVEHQPSEVVSCPRCTSILGMLLAEEGAYLVSWVSAL